MYNKDFKLKHIKFIYNKGLNHLKQKQAWLDCKAGISTSYEYELKLTAIVELLESIVVFHHGDGLDAFSNKNKNNKTIEERLQSFYPLIKDI